MARFKKVASQNKCSNNLYGLWINGVWSHNQVDIRMEVESYYMNLFKEEHPVRPLLDGMEFDCILDQEKSCIERPSSEEEVHLCILGMKGDKAPVPNNFTISFFQRCWNIVKGDLIKVMGDLMKVRAGFTISFLHLACTNLRLDLRKPLLILGSNKLTPKAHS